MKKLTDSQLALKEDSEYLTLNGRHILRRVMNEAQSELEKIHLEAQNRGEVVRVAADLEALAALLLSAAKSELKPAAKQTSKALSREEIAEKYKIPPGSIKELASVSNADS